MLPAPPASCAGWWFTQLWRALLHVQPGAHLLWALSYPEPGEIRAHLNGADAAAERIAGTLRRDAARRCAVTWEWPGEDGMLHSLQAAWQPGEFAVRPLEWGHQRLAHPAPDPRVGQAPWPLSVAIAVRGWHGQILEHADIVAADAAHAYPVRWAPPPGEPRLPITDLPCTLTVPDREHPDRVATLTLAGLTLPWRIDLDRESWPIWRRFSASPLLDRLGGPEGACPRHGHACPWPATGQVR